MAGMTGRHCFRLLFLVLVLHRSTACGADAVQPVKKYALLVGCTKYNGISNLEGPVNDVRMMSELLTKRFGFQPPDLHVLAGWPDDVKQRPTYANIVAGFEDLIRKAGPGEQIVILLSGHGSQVPVPASQTNLLDPKNPEPDGMDEVFLPSDVGKWKDGKVENCIIDDQLSDWLKKMGDKGASVWLVCDCCHSGTLSKSGAKPPDGVRWRSADPQSELGIPLEAIREAEQRAAVGGRSKGGATVEESPLGVSGPARSPAPTGNKSAPRGRVIAFFGAQPFEKAPEMPCPRQADANTKREVHGLLTYALGRALQQSATSMTYRELSQKVLASYRAENLSFLPTPFCEGDVDQEVLGLKRWPKRSRVVLERHEGKLFATAGELHGIVNGSILRVRPPAGSPDAKRRLGYLKVTNAGVMLSEVAPVPFEEDGKPVPAVPEKQFPELANCEIVLRNIGDLKLPLFVATTTGNEKQQTILKTVAAELAGPTRTLGRLTTADKAEWTVRAGDGKFELVRGRAPVGAGRRTGPQDAGLRTGPRVVQSYETDDAEKFTQWLKQDLKKIFIAQNVWRVAEAARSDMGKGRKPRFDFTVQRVSTGSAPVAHAPGSPAGSPNTAVAYPKDVLKIQFSNRRGIDDVWVTVLFLDSKYGIDVFVSDSIKAGEALKPLEIEITDETFGPEGLVVLVQNLKSFSQRQHFELLSQKQLGQGSRSAPAAAPNFGKSPFAALLSTATGHGGAKGFPLGHPANPVVFTYSWITRPRPAGK
jgi:Caspase domain